MFGLLRLLLLYRFVSLNAEDGMKEVFGVVGSSVLLDPEYGADLSNSDIIWMFTGSSGKPVTMLDYVPNHPKAEPSEQFKSRLHFNASSGCLMLKNLKPSDQGVYTITVNEDWKRSTDLKLIEPLSDPLINVSYVKTTIELTCRVSAGKVNSILWRKGDKVITNGQHYQLVQKDSKLIIAKASKSDCGIYTCTVENAVSKKNNSYSLAIYGLPWLHRYTETLSIAALITAALSLICRIISFLQKAKTICLQSLANVLQVMMFFLLTAAFVFWIMFEGAAEITTFMLGLLCLLPILILSTCSMMSCGMKRLNKILRMKFCHPKLMDAASALSAIIVICVSIILIVEIKKQADKGCEPTANLQSSIIPVVVVPLFVFFAVFILYTKSNKRRNGTLSANPNAKYPDELHRILNEQSFKCSSTVPSEGPS